MLKKMGNFNLKQILILVGFLLILGAIPLSFAMVKKTQIFKSSAQVKPKSVSQTPVTKSQPIPSISPLTELQKMLDTPSSPSAQQNTAPAPTPSLGVTVGPTLNLSINLEGRGRNNNAAKVFVGIVAGSATIKPSYTLSWTVDFPASGILPDLSLAGLDPGSTYTAYLKGPGQIDAASTFVMSPTTSSLNNGQLLTLLSGDLNEDNTINSADYTIVKNLYNSKPGDSNWNERADFNGDGAINNFDIAYIMKNFGKTGASGIWYSPPPTASPSASLVGGVGGPSGGGFWLWIPPK
ncbi:hypothetical protein HY385_01205 [Candidatus Daviesbacteria bacterium]|nr:hypothetical protein [Candidatus Daviesbacteria bacterium]